MVVVVDLAASFRLAASLLLLTAVAGQSSGGTFAAFVWKSEVPADCPFESSTLLNTVEFTGKFAAHGGADTWYPSWAADGNLYTPFTDGCVVDEVSQAKVCAASFCKNATKAGCITETTTGFAKVVGDDPLKLTVTSVGLFPSDPTPYHGRYPCGSVVVNGTWFFGTYTLDNENHEPGISRGRRLGAPLQPGYCGNWCIMGPFVGFRWSKDQGKTWNEPRVHMKGFSDNIFQEKAPDNHTSKVKFGAPHVVDFGRAQEHSPDGKIYIIGSGASDPYSPTSWMQGSECYIARVAPTVEAVEDLAKWEFFAGHDADGTPQWAAGDVAAAKPVLSWGNRTGVTTMTYVPALKRYLTIISTPTFSPFTEKQFDTYILESEAITGPYKMVSYLKEFGPQSYFVNIPSKFVDAEVRKSDKSLQVYFSYSANFHLSSSPKPPGSGYHWTLQQVRLSLR